MCYVYYIGDDGAKYIVCQNSTPIVFSEDDAWLFVEQTMAMEFHPKLMWVKEIKNANP